MNIHPYTVHEHNLRRLPIVDKLRLSSCFWMAIVTLFTAERCKICHSLSLLRRLSLGICKSLRCPYCVSSPRSKHPERRGLSSTNFASSALTSSSSAFSRAVLIASSTAVRSACSKASSSSGWKLLALTRSICWSRSEILMGVYFHTCIPPYVRLIFFFLQVAQVAKN